MTETLDPRADEVDQKQLAEQLLTQAKEQGVELMGPNGPLDQLTKNLLETALDDQMTEHLGYNGAMLPAKVATIPATTRSSVARRQLLKPLLRSVLV